MTCIHLRMYALTNAHTNRTSCPATLPSTPSIVPESDSRLGPQKWPQQADFSPESLQGQICSSSPSLSPSVLWERDLQAAVRRQMLATLSNGRSEGGGDMTLLRFPCPVAHSCHTPASNTDDNSREGALSICSPDTKTLRDAAVL